jgi:hypothetical protein
MPAKVSSPTWSSRARAMPRPEIIGWRPVAGKNCGRVLAIRRNENQVVVDVIFCEGGAYRGNTRFVVDFDTPFFSSLIDDAIMYTGPIHERQGRLWEFDYMKINVEMTDEGPAPWFERSQIKLLKIVPWPTWFDNRPRTTGKKGVP